MVFLFLTTYQQHAHGGYPDKDAKVQKYCSTGRSLVYDSSQSSIAERDTSSEGGYIIFLVIHTFLIPYVIPYFSSTLSSIMNEGPTELNSRSLASESSGSHKEERD
jgi:hypothetical protein